MEDFNNNTSERNIKKIGIFLKRWRKKLFSPMLFLLKILFAICLTGLIPILFLCVFLFVEPREIESINSYVDRMISKNLSDVASKSSNGDANLLKNSGDTDLITNTTGDGGSGTANATNSVDDTGINNRGAHSSIETSGDRQRDYAMEGSVNNQQSSIGKIVEDRSANLVSNSNRISDTIVYSYDSAKIEIDRKFRLAYHLYNVGLKFENSFLFLPEITLCFRFRDLLRKKFIVHRLKIRNLVSYVGYDSIPKNSHRGTLLLESVDKFKQTLRELLQRLQNLNSKNKKTRIISAVRVRNSTIYLYHRENGEMNKLDIVDSTFRLTDDSGTFFELGKFNRLKKFFSSKKPLKTGNKAAVEADRGKEGLVVKQISEMKTISETDAKKTNVNKDIKDVKDTKDINGDTPISDGEVAMKAANGEKSDLDRDGINVKLAANEPNVDKSDANKNISAPAEEVARTAEEKMEIIGTMGGKSDRSNSDESKIAASPNLDLANETAKAAEKTVKDEENSLIGKEEKAFKKNIPLGIQTNLDIRINGNHKSLPIDFYCKIDNQGSVECNLTINNSPLEAILSNLHMHHRELEKSLNNTRGNFTLETKFNFSNYVDFSSADFKLVSPRGNFNIRQLFGDNVNYQNFKLSGSIFGREHLVLHELKANLKMRRLVDFSLYLDCYRKQNLRIDIDILNGSIADIRVLWPVFLNDLNIRNWVIEHFKDGYFGKTFAQMDFDYNGGKNKFELTRLKSEVNIERVLLDYHRDFPAISDMNAKLIFTAKNMDAQISSAKIVNTAIDNGKIYIDFTSPKSFLEATAKTRGYAYEMMYFINNRERKKIKDLTTFYVDGYAHSDVKLSIPLSNTNFQDTSLKIVSRVSNNNTFLFSDNSVLLIDLQKNKGLNNFKVKFDCRDSLIDMNLVDFLKEKGETLTLALDVNLEENRVLLENMRTADSPLTFNGSGLVEEGSLKNLNFIDVNYGDNSFNVLYTKEKDGVVNVFLSGDLIRINKKIAQEDSNFLGRKPKNEQDLFNSNINCKFFLKNVLLNERYKLTDVSAEAVFQRGEIERLSLNNYRDDKNGFFLKLFRGEAGGDSYNLEAGCLNFGSFLSELAVTDRIIHGNLHLTGSINRKGDIEGRLKIDSGFSYVTNELGDSKFFSYLLNSDLTPKNIKNDLKSENTLNFSRLQLEFNLTDDKFNITKFLLNSSSVLGFGVSGVGEMNLSSGTMDVDGLVIPLEKLNTLFGMNKVPLIGKLLFGGENGGLVTIAYKFRKENYESPFDFKLLPSSVMNPMTLKNLLFIFILI